MISGILSGTKAKCQLASHTRHSLVKRVIKLGVKLVADEKTLADSSCDVMHMGSDSFGELHPIKMNRIRIITALKLTKN